MYVCTDTSLICWIFASNIFPLAANKKVLWVTHTHTHIYTGVVAYQRLCDEHTTQEQIMKTRCGHSTSSWHWLILLMCFVEWMADVSRGE